MVKEREYRESLSTWVSVVSIGGVVVLATIMIAASWYGGDKDTMKLVFTATLPLFGAWVGTILAFYYGKENFEAASRSVTNIAKAIGVNEKLQEIPVKDNMIPKRDMIVDDRPADQIKLTELLEKMSTKERLPILNKEGAVIYMIHRSAIDRYLAQKALQSPPPTDTAELTLKDLLDEDQELKKLFEQSFGFVKEAATLADAKTEMERKKSDRCQDVFVTRNGNKNEPVLGLITNNKIQELAIL